MPWIYSRLTLLVFTCNSKISVGIYLYLQVQTHRIAEAETRLLEMFTSLYCLIA